MFREMSAKQLRTQELLNILFEAKDCHSLLKKHLTKDVADKCKDRVTKLDGTLGDCIVSGVENLDSGTGIYASDPMAYDTFSEVFDAVIRDYHKIPAANPIQHPKSSFGNVDKLDFGNLDPSGKFIVSTRVRVGRSIDGYAFPPILKNDDRMKMEKLISNALKSFKGIHEGTYYPLAGMKKETQDQLVTDHFLFNDRDRFLKAAGGYNDWPNGRGIFFNQAKNFLVWVNEEDHMRIISMEMGGDLAGVYKRLVTAVQNLQTKLTFATHKKLGFLTFCPTNLGTTLRGSVHIKIPKVAALPKFKEICDMLQLQARGIDGEHTASVGGVYDISNKQRLGLTELEAVNTMARGVQLIILLEQSLP